VIHHLPLKFILALLLILWGAGGVWGQSGEEIETDRPDQTESSALVPKGAIQLETGYFLQKAKEEGVPVKTHAYPTALLRVGLLDWMELRVMSALRDSVVENGTNPTSRGLSPLNVGLKFKLWEEQGIRPEAALIVRAALPVGSRAYRPENPEPEIRLAFTNAISEKVDVAYNLTHSWVEGDPRRGYTLAMSGEVADRVTIFGEVFGQKQKGARAEHQADVGILYLLLPNLQLDLSAGTGLNKAAPDFFLTTGVSVRLPG